MPKGPCPVSRRSLEFAHEHRGDYRSRDAVARKDSLEVARRIVASVAADQETSATIKETVKGIEDVVSGKVRGLTEAEFRDALR